MSSLIHDDGSHQYIYEYNIYFTVLTRNFQEETISIARHSNALFIISYRVKQHFINGTGQFNDALIT